jgi:hypothetical protein
MRPCIRSISRCTLPKYTTDRRFCQGDTIRAVSFFGERYGRFWLLLLLAFVAVFGLLEVLGIYEVRK